MISHETHSPTVFAPLQALPGKVCASRELYDLVWSCLTVGRFFVVHSETTAERASLRIRARQMVLRNRRHLDAVKAFESALLGRAQKVIADELAVSLSTASAMLKQVAETMGFSCRFKRLPLAVPLLLHALRRQAFDEIFIGTDPAGDGDLCLTVRRFDTAFAESLSRGEYEVACALLEGKTHEEIAAIRHASTRTVANQLSSVFRKFGTSGRFELLRLAVTSTASNRLLEKLPNDQSE